MSRRRPILDNARLDIVSEGPDALKLALELGLLHTPSGSVRAESEHPTLGLVFFWTLPPKWDRRGRTLREDATAETLDGFPRLGVALPAPREDCPFSSPIKGYGYGLRLPGLLARVETYLKKVHYLPPPGALDDVGKSKGFRVYTEAWGRVGSSEYSAFAVQPAWAYQGK